MNQADLTQYLHSTYNSKELAQLLALAMDTGQLPTVPDVLPPLQPKRKRGRPTRKGQAQSLAKFQQIIEQTYPEQADLAGLAREAGITRTHAASLQSSLEFLARLDPVYGEWFTQLPLTFRGRLTPRWRAILDLHFYRLMLEHPGQRLPLFRQHAWIWGVQLRPDPEHLSRRDSQERARVLAPEFKAIRTQAEWKEPEPPTLIMPETEWPCTNNCEVGQAWGPQRHHILTLEGIRKVIGALPWLPTDRTYVSALTAAQALKQIIGVE